MRLRRAADRAFNGGCPTALWERRSDILFSTSIAPLLSFLRVLPVSFSKCQFNLGNYLVSVYLSIYLKGSMVTMDMRHDRVRVYCNADNIVTRPPRVG